MNIIKCFRVIKSRNRYKGLVVRIIDIRKPEKKNNILFGRHRSRWNSSIKIRLR